MVVINKYSSLQINSLASETARVIYDNTLNVLRFNNSSTYANVLVAKDLSNNLSSINNIITTGTIGINTSAPDKQVEINSATGDCLRLTYNDSDGTATNYVDILVSSSGDLTLTPSGGDVNISSHNGSTTGLQLNGTLVTSTAAELNYLDITTQGVAQASKALVVDSNRNIIDINYLEVANFTVVKQAPDNNSTLTGMSMIATPLSTAANGLGIGIEFDIVNIAGDVVPAGFINCVSSDLVADTENAFLEFKLINDGTVNTVATLSPAGVFTATTLSETSDVRMKENILDVEPAYSLSKILDVSIKEYNYTFENKEKRHTGVLAQSIKQILPQVVQIEKAHGLDDFHSVQYTGLVPHLINCVKELYKEIEELKKKL
jgi:Chaperone of endosialidase